MTFAPQTAKIFTHSLSMLHSASLPAFARCGHRTPVNQTLSGLENVVNISGFFLEKWG